MLHGHGRDKGAEVRHCKRMVCTMLTLSACLASKKPGVCGAACVHRSSCLPP